MKEKIKIGVVCLGRKTFDYLEAQKIYKQKIKELKNIENVSFEFVPDMVIEVNEAKNAALELLKKNIDAVIIISGTFHLGHLVLEINKIINKPVMLWGWNELPYNGGKIRLNSVCGVNLNASNLYKSGNREYYVSLGEEIDEAWVDAIRIKKALKTKHVGIIGYRAHGFFNVGIDDLASYRELGILVDHYELENLINISVKEDLVKRNEEELKSVFDVSGITEFQLNKVAQLVEKLRIFMKGNDLDALAIRCWPEFAGIFGISPCAAMSYLQSEDYILGCEGDLDGVFSMIAHKAIGAETPFLADFSQVDLKNNYALLWHCGVAPCNLADGKCTCSLDTYFAGGKGVTADFVMKEGEFSVCRLDSVNGHYRVFLEHGKAVPMKKELRGTYMKAIFDKPLEDVLNSVIYNGIAHHISVSYGNYIKPFEILARINDWEIIRG